MLKDTKSEHAKVIDFSSFRAKRTEEARRRFERYYLGREIGAYLCFENDLQIQINIVEVSEGGLFFEILHVKACALNIDQFKLILIRLFLTSNTFIDLPATIVHFRQTDGPLYVGCGLRPETASFTCYLAWLTFLKTYTKCGSTLGSGPEAA